MSFFQRKNKDLKWKYNIYHVFGFLFKFLFKCFFKACKIPKRMPHKAVYLQPFEQIGWPKHTMNILAAHLNTSRATERYLTNLELAEIGHQNVVYHIILSSLVLL